MIRYGACQISVRRIVIPKVNGQKPGDNSDKNESCHLKEKVYRTGCVLPVLRMRVVRIYKSLCPVLFQIINAHTVCSIKF